MSGYETFGEQHVKHLELIQGVIGRLGNDAFVVKGWAVTVVGALLGLAVNSEDSDLALVSVLPTLAFWGLDTYFLRSERLFRALYDQVRTGSDAVEPFFMGATSEPFLSLVSEGENRHITSWWRTALRPTLWILYATLIAAGALVAFLIFQS